MTNDDKKEARPFAGEHKIGFFEVITLGVIFVFLLLGIYHFALWLWNLIFIAS